MSSKITTEVFISRAKQIHCDNTGYPLYEYTRSVYVKSSQKLIITCKIHGDFEQTPSQHINGNRCGKCNGKGRSLNDFKLMSQKKFGEDMFDYSKAIFVNMHTRLTLICKKGHEFNTEPEVHLREGSLGGCVDCAKSLCKERKSYTQQEWIELASNKHNKLYNYEKVKYISSQKNITIICPLHGDFEQTPASHLRGAGCNKCAINKKIKIRLYKKDDFVKIFEECSIVHSNKYTYSNIFRKNGYLFIEIICKKHGTFSQRYDHHKRGHGCFKCIINYSKPQVEWLNYLSVTSDYIQHAQNEGEFQIPTTNMYADGYEPTKNNIYEFQGDFWHGNPAVFNGDEINPRTGTTYLSLYKKTKNKIEKLKGLGYNVYEMWESDWEKGKKAIITLQHIWKIKHYTNSH